MYIYQVWELPRELGAKPGEEALIEGGRVARLGGTASGQVRSNMVIYTDVSLKFWLSFGWILFSFNSDFVTPSSDFEAMMAKCTRNIAGGEARGRCSRGGASRAWGARPAARCDEMRTCLQIVPSRFSYL